MKAIKESIDSKGFMSPVVDENKCVHCNRCRKVCPVHCKNINVTKGKVYACWSNNKNKRYEATSGGVFFTIAEKFITDGGIVYGAVFENNMVFHMRATTKEDVMRMSGSKYVQSNTNKVFSEVKEDLDNGKKVLFSGTPCQVSAIKNYVGEKTNLFCIDLICHGVPSPNVFKKYIGKLEKEYGAKIQSISFRRKIPNWTVFSMDIVFENGKRYLASKFQDPFLNLFLEDLMLRESCFHCNYTTQERCGDITLGDFWGIKAEHFSQRGIEKGVNLVIVNNEAGTRLLFDVVAQLYCKEYHWKSAIESNQSLTKPWNKPEKYEQFWIDYEKMSYDQLEEKYHVYDKKIEAKRLKEAHSRARTYLIPYPLRVFIRGAKKIIRVVL